MKKILFSLLIIFSLSSSIFGLDVPYLSGRVVDETGTLSDSFVNSLSDKLKIHEKSTSNQIVVLIIPSLEGEVLEEFSIKVASAWKLGQKGKDNGVLLLVAKKDKKMRIEVGYGLEGTLTDALCSQIIRKEIVPEFKKGDFEKGIQSGVDSIMGAISGTYNQNKSESEESPSEGYKDFISQVGDSAIPFFFRLAFGSIFVVVITPFTIIALTTPYIGWFIYFFLFPFYATFPVVALGPFGGIVFFIYAVFGFIFRIIYLNTEYGKELQKKIKKKYKFIGQFSEISKGKGGGSSSGGSWSSGSGSSGGGFSGGGGSFGGGGSSGSW